MKISMEFFGNENFGWYVYTLAQNGGRIKLQSEYNSASYDKESSFKKFKERIHELGFILEEVTIEDKIGDMPKPKTKYKRKRNLKK